MNESGGHRWQRIPPTERNGRVQTSTVTVYVYPLEMETKGYKFSEKDLEIRYTTAGGNGGQHQNKTLSACHIRHVPTGITVSIRTERSQPQNRRLAFEILEARLKSKHESEIHCAANNDRKQNIGSGQRGDKVKTYSVKHDMVIDHLTGNKLKLSKVLKGIL